MIACHNFSVGEIKHAYEKAMLLRHDCIAKTSPKERYSTRSPTADCLCDCREYMLLPFYARRVHLATILRRGLAMLQPGEKHVKYFLDARAVCRKCFCWVMGIGLTSTHNLLSQLRELPLSSAVPQHASKVSPDIHIAMF